MIQEGLTNKPGIPEKRLDGGAYSWVNIVIPLCLLIYLFLGTATKFTREVFPFFHWALFALSSSDVERYELRLVDVDGERYTPPLPLSDLPEFRLRMYSTPDLYDSFKVAHRLGSSYGKNASNTERFRESLERSYLPAGQVNYQVVKVRYNPVERYLNDVVMSEDVIVTYTKQTGQEPLGE